MTALATSLTTPPQAPQPIKPPDHKDLPQSDGAIAENFLEAPQGTLLTNALFPVLKRLHPDGQFAIGLDSGIYYRWTDPPLNGCRSPDWFYVPGVPPMLQGEYRRSYVQWQEMIAPLLLIEFVSGDGSEERDATPGRGKFWIYEQAIRAPYYAIYEVDPGQVEVHHLVDGRYVLLAPNARGHFPIASLGVELGIWQGCFRNIEAPWLRFYDAQGNLLPFPDERAEQERRDKEQAQRLAEQERLDKEQAQRLAEQERLDKEQAQRLAQRLAERLRALGIDPEAP